MIEWIEEVDPALVSRLTKPEWVSPPDEVREYIVEATPETSLALAKETGCQPERIITGQTPVAGFWNDGPEVQRRTGEHLGPTGSTLIPFLDLDHADQEGLVGMMTGNGYGATPEELSADYISRMLARFEHEAPGFIRWITSNPAQE